MCPSKRPAPTRRAGASRRSRSLLSQQRGDPRRRLELAEPWSEFLAQALERAVGDVCGRPHALLLGGRLVEPDAVDDPVAGDDAARRRRSARAQSSFTTSRGRVRGVLLEADRPVGPAAERKARDRDCDRVRVVEEHGAVAQHRVASRSPRAGPSRRRRRRRASRTQHGPDGESRRVPDRLVAGQVEQVRPGLSRRGRRCHAPPSRPERAHDARGTRTPGTGARASWIQNIEIGSHRIPAHDAVVARSPPRSAWDSPRVSPGHYLASAAGSRSSRRAATPSTPAAAPGIALAVLHADEVNFAGVAPIMIRTADGRDVTIDGLGVWPAVDPRRPLHARARRARSRPASCAPSSRPRPTPGSPRCATTGR